MTTATSTRTTAELDAFTLDRYAFANGEPPSGRGWWLFDVAFDGSRQLERLDVPGFNLWSVARREALRLARLRAAERGATRATVHVCT